MKKIKIIDLLYKRAKGEEVPKKIKFDGYEYSWNDDVEDYENVNEDFFFSTINLVTECLNYEVEILDEEDEFEDIEEMKFNYQCNDEEKILVNFDRHREYINSLLRNQKKIIERLKDK